MNDSSHYQTPQRLGFKFPNKIHDGFRRYKEWLVAAAYNSIFEKRRVKERDGKYALRSRSGPDLLHNMQENQRMQKSPPNFPCSICYI